MAANQPDGGRRTFSGKDANVTYLADENATLVPSTTHRQSTGHDAGSSSKTSSTSPIRHRPSTSQFSQQLQAASYNIKHFDQHQADFNQIEAALPASAKGVGLQLYPDVYVAPQTKSKNVEGKIEKPTASDGSSHQPSIRTAHVRTRPSPLQIKRSLSNVKSALKSHRTTNTLFNKLGLSGHGTQSVADSVSPPIDAKKPLPHNTAPKAARTLGGTSITASNVTKTPSTANTFGSATSLKNQTPLPTASTSTPGTLHSGYSKRHRTNSSQESISQERLNSLNRTLAHGVVSQYSLFATQSLPTPDDVLPPAVPPKNSGSDAQQSVEQRPPPNRNNAAASPLHTDVSLVEPEHVTGDAQGYEPIASYDDTGHLIYHMSQPSSRDVSGASRMTVPIRFEPSYEARTEHINTPPNAAQAGPRPWYPPEVNDALTTMLDFESEFPQTLTAFNTQNHERSLALQEGLRVLFYTMSLHPAVDYRAVLDRVNGSIRSAITSVVDGGVQVRTHGSYERSIAQPSSYESTAPPSPMPFELRHGVGVSSFDPIATAGPNMNPSFFIPGSNDSVSNRYTQNANHSHGETSKLQPNPGRGGRRGLTNAGETLAHQNRYSQESVANQNRYSQESVQTQPEVFHMTGVNTPAQQSPERYDPVYARNNRSNYASSADIAHGMLLPANPGGSIRPNYFERLGRPYQQVQQPSQHPLPANCHQQAPHMSHPYFHMSQLQPQPYMPHETQYGQPPPDQQDQQQNLHGHQDPQVQQGFHPAHMPGMGVAYRDETRRSESRQRPVPPTDDMHREELRQEEQMNREWLRNIPNQRLLPAQNSLQAVPRNLGRPIPRPPRTHVPGQGAHLRDIHPAHRP